MKRLYTGTVGLIILSTLAITVTPASRAAGFGSLVEELLEQLSEVLFGFRRPLPNPANAGDAVPREMATANDRQLLAGEGELQAEFVARNVAVRGDMIALWPNENDYTHLIICIEQSRRGMTPAGNEGLNPAVQRVDVATRQVATILHGMSRCDGVRTTPWGTVLAAEEVDDGRVYEIIDPTGTNGHWVADRVSGDIRDGIDSPRASTQVIQRRALPTISWEGFTVLESGVVFGVDELTPGSDGLPDSDGGALFKFLPDRRRNESGPLSDLSDSPLVSGKSFAMTISCRESTSSTFPQYGQGCEVGQGAWVKVNAPTARSDADAAGATGHFKPEDLHRDPLYEGEGVRLCWTDSGRASAGHFAEVMCAIDADPDAADERVDPRTGLVYLAAGDEFAVVTANRFVEGDGRFNSYDNLAFQPVTGNVYVAEDAQFGEVFACLPDGDDRDTRSDGCVALLSITDPDAEPTGFIFDATGATAFYIVQHGEQSEALKDFVSNPVDGETDDLIKITGFRLL
ncbi:MAG: alkaline phosphatase PhoX [Acidobacteriota bacterium]